MRPDLLVGVQHWKREQIANLRGLPERVAGIILGDPFCPQRMFEHGNWDIPIIAEAAKEAGLSVAFQTPVYLTPRNLNDALNLIGSLRRRELLDLLFVQDVGLLVELGESDMQIPACWSLWGEDRGSLLSRDLLDFLTQLNVQYLETNRPSRIGRLQEYGVKVVYRLYAPQVATFGRFCYTQHVTGLPCNRGYLCEHERPIVVSTDTKLELRAAGYTLEHLRPFHQPSQQSAPDYTAVYLPGLSHLPRVLGHDAE